MVKVKKTDCDRVPMKGKTAAPKKAPKKKPRTRKIKPKFSRKGKRSATAAPPPGTFDESSEEETLPQPSTSNPTPNTDDNEDDSDDDDDDKIGRKKIKIVLRSVEEPKKPPPQPKLHRMTLRQRLTSTGLNDVQINQYLSLTGFDDIGPGYAAMKGDVVVVKSGYIRLLVTPDHKHYAIPNSMTCEDWAIINFFRVLCRKTILIFVTREYAFPKFIKPLGRNSPIPTDAEIIKNYCKHKIKNGEEEVWQYRQAHSALLMIKGTTFRLFDANNYEGIKLNAAENLFVKDFFQVFKRRGFPHIYRALGLKAADCKDYKIANCFYSKGVDNSCANYLLFVVEQLAIKQSIIDVNFTPALAQLFARKVDHFVGGLVDFDTFRRNNPYWPNMLPPFLAEPFLTELKAGANISTRELNENLERIEFQLSLELETE